MSTTNRKLPPKDFGDYGKIQRKSTADNFPKVSKKLEQILEYSDEFEALIRHELDSLDTGRSGAGTPPGAGNQRPATPPRAGKQRPATPPKVGNQRPATWPGAGNQGPVSLCACVTEQSSVEVMEDTLLTNFIRDRDLIIMNPSFDFRNHARIAPQKYRFEATFDTRSLEQFHSSTIKPFLDRACLGVVSTILNLGKKSRLSTDTLESTGRFIIQELLSPAGSSWTVSLSCLEIFGSKSCDLLNMNQIVSTEKSPPKTGSAHSPARTDFTEVPCTSIKQWTHVFSRVLRLRKSARKAHFLCKIRLKHKSGMIDDSWINLVDMAEQVRDTDNLIRKSYMVLKDCITARTRASLFPTRYTQIPYQSSQLTSLLADSFSLQRAGQSTFLCIAHFGSTVLDTSNSIDIARFAISLRASPRTDNLENTPQRGMEPTPLDWGVDETVQWFQLNSEIPVHRIPRVCCADLLELSQIQFLKVVKGSSPSTNTQSILGTLDALWEEVEQSRNQEKNKIISQHKRGFSNKETRWRLQDTLEKDDINNSALGTSKNKYEAGLNKGFEKNLPRFERRTKNMMQLEWIEKVKASDRAEAKLYPILSIDTKQQKPKVRRNSIYE